MVTRSVLREFGGTEPDDDQPATAGVITRSPARSIGSAAFWVVRRIYPLLLVVLVWHLYSVRRDDEFLVPRPLSVWDRAVALWRDGVLGEQTWITVQRILWSFAIALLVGATVGLLMGRVGWVRRMLRPITAFLFPLPKIAVYPAMLIVFGFGSSSKVALGVAEATFPIMLATAAAASQLPAAHLWSARSLGSSHLATFFRVTLPGSLPGILTGARIGLIGAIIGVFVGEMISSTTGLGQVLTSGSRRLRTSDVYVAVGAIAVVGLLLDRSFLMIRRRLLVWSHE